MPGYNWFKDNWFSERQLEMALRFGDISESDYIKLKKIMYKYKRKGNE